MQSYSVFVKKPGFIIDLIDAAIIIISIIAVQGALVLIASIMADFMDAHLLDVILHMPKFHYTIIDGVEYGGHFWTLYEQLRWAAIIVFSAIIVLSAAVKLLGQIEIYGDGKFWSSKIRISVAMIIFLMIFPVAWDGAADAVAIGSTFVLNPVYSYDGENPCPADWSDQQIVDHYNESLFKKDGDAWGFITYDTDKAEIACTPNFKLHYLLEQLRKNTSYEMPDIPNPLEWVSHQISLALTGIISQVFFSAIRSIVTIQATILSTMIAIMTNMLTGMIVAGLPIFVLLSQIPKFDKISEKFLSALPALLLVPLLSSLVISLGATFVSTVGTLHYEPGVTIAGLDPGLVYTWLATIGVLMFAVTLPITLVPLLSNVTMQATQVVTSSVQAAAVSAAVITGGAAKSIGGRMRIGGSGSLGGNDGDPDDDGVTDEVESEGTDLLGGVETMADGQEPQDPEPAEQNKRGGHA